jgi:hypothetical protein
MNFNNMKNEVFFPEFSIDEDNNVLVTRIRCKSTVDGKWYIGCIRVDYSNLSLGDAIMKLMMISYRTMLFGVPSLTFVDIDTKQPIWKLDENQYSEYGRLYLSDSLFFPKGAPPNPSKFPAPYDEELMQLWQENYGTK